MYNELYLRNLELELMKNKVNTRFYLWKKLLFLFYIIEVTWL